MQWYRALGARLWLSREVGGAPAWLAANPPEDLSCPKCNAQLTFLLQVRAEGRPDPLPSAVECCQSPHFGDE